MGSDRRSGRRGGEEEEGVRNAPNVALQSAVLSAPKRQVPTLSAKQRGLRFRRQTHNEQGLSRKVPSLHR